MVTFGELHVAVTPVGKFDEEVIPVIPVVA